ncbi:hypothetical protein FQA39_LY15479 [Lamprigera yunnana]|nr:hypothetical protein FQA39_LY15479 [Lamprigera yunnana]
MSDEREAMIGSEIDAPRSENNGQESSVQAKVENKVKKQKPQSVKIRANKNLDKGEDVVSDSSVDMVLESEEEADWPQVEEDESTLEELNSHYEITDWFLQPKTDTPQVMGERPLIGAT